MSVENVREIIACLYIFVIALLLVYAVCEGSESDRTEILKEFEAVLKMTSTTSKPTQSSATTSTSPSQFMPESMSAGHDLKWLASQTLFSTLDHMNRWLRKKYLNITARIKRSDDPEVLTSKDKVPIFLCY